MSSPYGPHRRQPARWALAAGALAVMAGCASGSGPSEADQAAAARGQALAAQTCGACHGLGPDGASRFAGAPAFRDMRFDANAIGRERSMARMHLGRVSMPPAEISDQDVADIGAYIRGLRRAGGR